MHHHYLHVQKKREIKKGNHLHGCVSIIKCDDSIYVIKFKFEFKSFQNFPLFFLFFKVEQRREAITKMRLITRQDNSISSRERGMEDDWKLVARLPCNHAGAQYRDERTLDTFLRERKIEHIRKETLVHRRARVNII